MRPMTARYPGRCRGCGLPIKRGAQIIWSRRTGALHNGACLDMFDGTEFGRFEAEQEARAHGLAMDDEIRQGMAEVAQIQAISAPGSALREQLYMEMEMRDYNLGLVD